MKSFTLKKHSCCTVMYRSPIQCIKECDAIDVQYICAVSKYSEINIGEND